MKTTEMLVISAGALSPTETKTEKCCEMHENFTCDKTQPEGKSLTFISAEALKLKTGSLSVMQTEESAQVSPGEGSGCCCAEGTEAAYGCDQALNSLIADE